MNRNEIANKLINELFKQIYWPICRVYARLILRDRPADTLYRLLCSPQFWRAQQFWPNFVRPRRFTEKLWSFMFSDRDPQLTLITDKLRVRDYVKAKAGNEYLIPLLWRGKRPEDIPYDELPIKFVIKANHGCGYNIIVKDKTRLDQKNTRLKLQKWLSENYCRDKYLGAEWGYRNISPVLLIEEFLEENGKPPADYKFYCFSGRIEFLSVHFDRFEEHSYKSFDRNFEPYELQYDLKQWNGESARPPNFDVMLQLAESLAGGFHFMRVDLYSLGNRVYFGELTPYPGGGFARFLPPRTDYLLGERWRQR